MVMDTLSRNARDLVALRRWLYGDESAQRLMLGAYRRSKAAKVNEATILRVWVSMDEALTEEEAAHADGWRRV